MDVPQEPIEALWERYQSTRDVELKNQLVLRYIPLVRTIVQRMMPVQQAHNQYDDMISCGVIGLMNAIERFDPSHDVRFATYAHLRIRGEIIDNIRKQDWAPSNLRRQIGQINRCYDDLEIALERSPTDQEVAGKLGITEDELHRTLDKSYSFNLVYFEDMLGDARADDEGLRDDDVPGDSLEKDELRRIMGRVIDELPKNERIVISLYYYDELPFKDIAQVLGVSVSRISQIHSKVLERLKGMLDGYVHPA